ncbi:MAG: aspartate-semialdehyde dehydrogenase [Holosporales bacterium]|jgi:aspartate-semialdehyde dehydrogenase|nr:aspartate-semialdehyde dehydrogenase [Holosporales bacterium]
MKNKRIIVVGATGRVGREILSILLENNVPISHIECAASAKSDGIKIQYGDDFLVVRAIDKIDFSKYNIGLFSAGSEVSRKYAPIAAKLGCIVIDNTSYFRMHDDVPLIVPEINLASCKNHKNIIANPNCSTIQMVMVLKPLHDTFGGLSEVVVSSYQSVSGAGQKGIEELLQQTMNIINNNSERIEINTFKKQIAFNLIPQIDSFTDSLYTKEELKMMDETKKILGLDNVDITATCVRVPVLVSHSVSVFAKFEKNVNLNIAIDSLKNFPGIKIMDNTENYIYTTPIDAVSKNDVYVSRIRKHPRIDNSISFWCVSDNLRKGAALNAVQIAKKLK